MLLVSGFPPRRPDFGTRSGHVRFVVDKMAPGQIPPSTSISCINFHSSNKFIFINHPLNDTI
jgi:hypothetical protein